MAGTACSQAKPSLKCRTKGADSALEHQRCCYCSAQLLLQCTKSRQISKILQHHSGKRNSYGRGRYPHYGKGRRLCHPDCDSTSLTARNNRQDMEVLTMPQRLVGNCRLRRCPSAATPQLVLCHSASWRCTLVHQPEGACSMEGKFGPSQISMKWSSSSCCRVRHSAQAEHRAVPYTLTGGTALVL